MHKIFTNFLDGMEKGILVVIGIMLMVMTGTIFYQVILRYIFSLPNIWAEELSRFLFVWISLLGSAVAIRRNCHLKIEFFLDILRPKARAAVEVIIYLLVMVFLCVVLRYGLILCSNTTNNLSAGLRIPMAIPYSSIAVGCILMLLYAIELILKRITVLFET